MKEEVLKESLHGQYKMMNIDDDGNVVWESDWVHNQIVDSYAYVMTQLFLDKNGISSSVPFMAIGSDGTRASSSDLRLRSERYRVATKVAKADYDTDRDGLFRSSDEAQINAVDITGVFEKGISLDIKEIGLFWGVGATSSANTGFMISRKDIPEGWSKSTDTRSIFVYRLIFRGV